MTDGTKLLAALAGTPQPLLLGAAVERGAALSDFQAAASTWGRPIDLPMFFLCIGRDPLWWSGYPGIVKTLGGDAMHITTDPIGPLSQALDGRWDAWIATEAKRAVAYGKPVLVRLAHEMNGGGWNSYGFGQESGPDFVRAWQYIVTRFRQLGATNLLWCWAPNVWTGSGDSNTADPSAYFPGDDYVDFVGLDGYCSLKSAKARPADLYLANYATLAALSTRPFMLAEFGVAAGRFPPGGKALWYRELATTLGQMPRCVSAHQWQRKAAGADPDYSHDSSGREPDAAAAFAAVVTAPPFA
ncbi:glycoside hydrolase family 26 protein [Enterococcus hirae]|uniref:glycoside hydrolase family 26 protein n=1 Tax=Enterococcus hirae TaxID=1354 RepID=UPI001369B61B|nr:glycosyl hydrolase [Enterococcus hirae]NAE18242.1 hypothetical protein [Enterococcus hirae]